LYWQLPAKRKESKYELLSRYSYSKAISNNKAAIRLEGGQFYIIEQGTIDSKLRPCNLPKEFQVHDLPVTVSGEVKLTQYNGGMPCCTDNFEITKIIRFLHNEATP
jgi:hypothetical protein